MQPIHVDTEQLYAASRALWQNHLDLIDQIDLLHMSSARLEMAWQGGLSEEFTSEFDALLQKMNLHAEELFSMGLTLSRQGEKWDESDQRWDRDYRSLMR
jgi:uncharacterized protein YukE